MNQPPLTAAQVKDLEQCYELLGKENDRMHAELQAQATELERLRGEMADLASIFSGAEAILQRGHELIAERDAARALAARLAAALALLEGEAEECSSREAGESRSEDSLHTADTEAVVAAALADARAAEAVPEGRGK